MQQARQQLSEWCAGLADDNAKVQAAAANMLNLALTLPDAPSDLCSVLVGLDCASAVTHKRHTPAFVWLLAAAWGIIRTQTETQHADTDPCSRR